MKLHYCRICLKNVGRVSLKTVLSVGAKYLSHSEVIKYCLDLQVLSKSDKFNRVCKQCSKKLASFYQFKYKARKNDHSLQLMTLVDEENPIKVEVAFEGESSDGNTQAEIRGETYFEEEYVHDKELPKMCSNEQTPVKVEKTDEFGDLADEPEILQDGIKTEDIQSDGELVKEEKIQITECRKMDLPEELPKKRKRKLIKQENIELERDPSESSDSGPDIAESDEEFNLKTHLKEIRECTLPSTTKKYERRKKICDSCGKLVTRLTRHACVPKHMVPVEVQYDCELCAANTKGSRKYFRFFEGVKKDLCHACFINNSKKENLRHICPTCGLGRSSKTALNDHMAKHTNERPFKCPKCSSAFKTMNTMKDHISFVHEKAERKFRCTECPKSFYHNRALKRHKISHSGLKEFKCQLCPNAYSTLQGLKQHLQVHAGDKREVCPVCGKGFIFKSTLFTHMKIHTAQPRVQCRYCSQTFTRADNRTMHERLKHHNQEVTEAREKAPRKTRAVKVSNLSIDSLKSLTPKSPNSSNDGQ